MPNSYQEYLNPTGNSFTFTFKILNIDDVHALGFNGTVWQSLSISQRVAATKTITLSSSISSGTYTKLRLYRQSTTNALIDFSGGARLTENELDTAYQQSLFVAQELSEDSSTTQYAAAKDASILAGTTLANFASEAFTATSNQTEFNISTFTPQTSAPEAYRVGIDGVMQSPTDAYTISMNPAKLTLTSAAPTGAKVVIVTAASAASATAVDDATIEVVTSTNKIQVKDSGITNAKLAGSITQDKLAGGITNAQLAGSITEDKLAGSIPTSKLTGIIDDDTFTTGVTSTSLSSSESIKAYIDAQIQANCLGVGQKWSHYSRAFDTTYTNNTGKPIAVAGKFDGDTDDHYVRCVVTHSDNTSTTVPFANSTNSGGGVNSRGYIVIPTGASYRFTKGGNTINSYNFYELR